MCIKSPSCPNAQMHEILIIQKYKSYHREKRKYFFYKSKTNTAFIYNAQFPPWPQIYTSCIYMFFYKFLKDVLINFSQLLLPSSPNPQPCPILQILRQ